MSDRKKAVAQKKAKKAHIFARNPHDYYIEPYSNSRALFAMEEFKGGIWDPACGSGRILRSATEYEFPIFGSDIEIRSTYCHSRGDFLKTETMPEGCRNIVSNPPFKIAERFVQHAIELIPKDGKVAMLLPLGWLVGFSSKRSWMPKSNLIRVYPISPRPSMPPGEMIEAGVKPKGGRNDFAWYVWGHGPKRREAENVFMNTKGY